MTACKVSSDMLAHALTDTAHSGPMCVLTMMELGQRGNLVVDMASGGHDLEPARLGDTPRLPQTPRCPNYQPDRPAMLP
jgi:hypothetical protein